MRLPAPRFVHRVGLCSAIALSSACATVPVTGRQQLLLVDEAQEMQLGAQAYDEVLSKEKVLNDPALQAVIERVGKRIAAATGRTDYQWEFKVIDNDQTVNAFALPGGKVAVYTGILPLLRDEHGLAAVMGHEVAHAIARHGGERISTNMLAQGGLSLAGVAAGMATKNETITQGVVGLLGVGTELGVILPFSRKQESEADRLGLEYMAKAGYDPTAARDLWVRMGQQGASKPPEFLSTHPADDTRVKQIDGWLAEVKSTYAAVAQEKNPMLPAPARGAVTPSPSGSTGAPPVSGVPPARNSPASGFLPSGTGGKSASPSSVSPSTPAPASAPSSASPSGVPPAKAPSGVPPKKRK